MSERIIFEDNINDMTPQNSGGESIIKADNKFTQALSFMFGWIPTARRWTQLLADSDGRLLVSTSPTKSNEGNHSNPNLAITSFTVLAENEDRKAYIIQNNSGNDVYLSFDGGAATINDFKLVDGATFIDDVYFGLITGISLVASGSLNVLEMS